MKRRCMKGNTSCSGMSYRDIEFQDCPGTKVFFRKKTWLKKLNFNLEGINQTYSLIWVKTLFVVCGLVMPFFFLGCSSEEDWMENIDQEGFLLLNYQAMIRASEDQLFLEVTEIDDKRCPIGVVCPKDAIANIVINARLGNEQQTFTLQTAKLHDDIKTSELIFNHRIEMVDLSPYPYCSEPLQDKRGYIVRLKVEPVGE